MLQIAIFTLMLIICKSLDGPNYSICKYQNGTEYCCYGYGVEGGRCVVCHVGYESHDGSPCVPCQPRMYGKDCTKECLCEIIERCDGVTGTCYKYTEISTLSITVQAVRGMFSTYDTTESTYITEEMTNNDQEDETNAFNDLGLSNKGVVVYSMTVTGVIFLLCGMHCFNKYRKGRRHRPSNENQIAPGSIGPVEIEEQVYDLIDENNMNESRNIINDANVNGYLEVVDRNSNSESSVDEKDDSENYLNPYESFAKTGYRFEYKNNHPNDSSCSTIESGNDEVERTNEVYLNVYEPLIGNRQLINHAYEIPVIYNAMKCKTVNSRSVSSGSLTIRHTTNVNSSCRRYSI